MSRRARAARGASRPDAGWESVKVVFLCPENPAHVLGAVARQVHSVPGSAAGREVHVDENGLGIERGPGGEVKLSAACRVCAARGSRRTTQLRWERVGALLDRAERTDGGMLRYQLTG